MAMQAWGVMEWRQGNYSAAKRLFEKASRVCPPHAPLLAAWADMEVIPAQQLLSSPD
jgi:hypothetical protein